MSRILSSRMVAESVNRDTLSGSEDEKIVISEGCAKGTPINGRRSRTKVQSSPRKNTQRLRSGSASSSESDCIILASSQKASKNKINKEASLPLRKAKNLGKGNRPDDFSEDELALEDPRSDVWKGRKESFAVVVPPRRLSRLNPSSQNAKAGLMASGGKGKRLTSKVAGPPTSAGKKSTAKKQTSIASFFSSPSQSRSAAEPKAVKIPVATSPSKNIASNPSIKSRVAKESSPSSDRAEEAWTATKSTTKTTTRSGRKVSTPVQYSYVSDAPSSDVESEFSQTSNFVSTGEVSSASDIDAAQSDDTSQSGESQLIIDDEESEEKPLKRLKLVDDTSKKPKKKSTKGSKNADDTSEESAQVSEGLLDYKDKFAYRTGLDESLPPISDNTEIFRDQVKTAVDSFGFDKVLGHLNGRKLKIGTMCSGTESPVLALQQYSEGLRHHHGLSLEVEHLFSAEIVPYKQAYIERNFNPPIIFRDIKELVSEEEATTAYGAKVPIPEDLDLLIAGFSCVDFSGLNGSKKTLEERGESGDTFYAILDYCNRKRPKMVVLENVKSAPWEKIAQFFPKIGYSAEWSMVDTKDYYIPHTRQRGYLVAIDNESFKGADKAVREWKNILGMMKRRASSGVESFLLQSDDPRLVRAAEDMSSTGSEEKRRTEVDWTTCEGRHVNYRDALGLGRKRPLLQWENGGTCTPQDYMHQKWLKGQVERVWDYLEVANLRNFSRGFDQAFKNRNLECSQNVDRVTDNTAAGITGCLTPTGTPYSTTRGGPISGLESLALQGLPIDKLQLTRESQAKLQDLAGNAMSATVVGASILAALIVGHKALKRGDGDVEMTDSQAVSKLSGTNYLEPHVLDPAGYQPTPVKEVLEKASLSSRKCYCEGRLQLASASLQQCKFCKHTVCSRCNAAHKHDYRALPSLQRISPIQFEEEIKMALPMRIQLIHMDIEKLESMKAQLHVFDSDWKRLRGAVEKALDSELRYSSAVRSQQWTIHFDSECAHMELAIESHKAEWRLFAKPPASAPVNSPIRKLLQSPFARMQPIGSDLIIGDWYFCFPVAHTFDVQIEGIKDSEVPSYEAVMGLADFVHDEIFSKLEISLAEDDKGALDMDISGTYQLRQNCDTAGGTLHVQEKTKNSTTPLFLYLDPDQVGHPDDDFFVFSTDKRRLEFGEYRSRIARLQKEWRPSRVAVVDNTDTNKTERGERKHIIQALKAGPVKVQCIVDGHWVKTKASLKIPSHEVTGAYRYTPAKSLKNLQNVSCETTQIMLTCEATASMAENSPWQINSWIEVAKVDEQKFFSAFAWLSERARKIPGYGDWHEIGQCEPSNCATCAPKLPAIKWKLATPKASKSKAATATKKASMEVMKMMPFEDAQEAAPFERAMKNRPSPFIIQFKIDGDDNVQLRLGLNPVTLMHRALAKLSNAGISSEMTIGWRLITNYAPPAKPTLQPFTLMSNDEDKEASQPRGFHIGMKLRPEQLRSLNWMITQEADDVTPFIEEEIEEAAITQIGWRAEGRATKPVVIQGGVLADQVGYGKTITTLALIDSKREKDSKESTKPVIGAIPIKATLILVPPQLPEQWMGEIKKFMKPTYKVLVIKNAQALAKYTIKDFMGADIIIANWKLGEGPAYLAKVASFSGLLDPPEKSGARAEAVWYEQARRNIAKHVDMLKDGGVNLFDYIEEIRVANENAAQNAETYVPSKRLRGQAYQDAKKASASTKGVTAGAKRSREDSEETPQKPVRKPGVDVFKLKPISKGSDWTKFQGPLLEMFKFNRLVVDEYTYVTGKEGLTVPNLKSRYRWILSGTPPMQDFADVKSIAKFMGINLGVDDTTPGVIKEKNIASILKGQTESEEFRSFRTPASPAWHEHRHRHAQKFLNHFVRQNIARISDIPNTDHLQAVTLPAAERAIYLELQQLLAATDFRMTKGRKNEDNDRLKRIEELLGQSATPDEALLKCASHFKLDDQDNDTENAPKACDVIVGIRTRQYGDLKSSFESKLKQAWWLKNGCLDEDEHFKTWINVVENNRLGDDDATKEIIDMINEQKAKYNKDDWRLFYVRSHNSDEVSGKKKNVKPEGRHQKTGVCLKRAALRSLVNDLRKSATELVNRKRSLRLFQEVRSLQLQYTNARTGMDSQQCQCVKCGGSFLPQDVSVMTSCGHVACNNCLAARKIEDICVDGACDAVNRPWQIVAAPELGEEDKASRKGVHFGRKLEELIDMIHAINNDDQILLFVQFSDLMKKVIDALRVKSITHYAITNKATDASKILSAFQNESGKDKKKVLILNIGDASAAGSNITNANHVIFLAPYLTDQQQTYDSAMTQAVGRARRYGQTKHVHIYHFVSLKTIDVDTLQARTGKTVVRDEDVEVNDKPFDEFKSCGFDLVKLGEGARGEFGSAVASKMLNDEEDE